MLEDGPPVHSTPLVPFLRLAVELGEDVEAAVKFTIQQDGNDPDVVRYCADVLAIVRTPRARPALRGGQEVRGYPWVRGPSRCQDAAMPTVFVVGPNPSHQDRLAVISKATVEEDVAFIRGPLARRGGP